MAIFKITISNAAQKQLNKIQDPSANRIINTILKLAGNPRPAGYVRLKGRDGYRVRAGDYRIIYDVFDDQLIVQIVAIGHRREIYK